MELSLEVLSPEVEMYSKLRQISQEQKNSISASDRSINMLLMKIEQKNEDLELLRAETDWLSTDIVVEDGKGGEMVVSTDASGLVILATTVLNVVLLAAVLIVLFQAVRRQPVLLM